MFVSEIGVGVDCTSSPFYGQSILTSNFASRSSGRFFLSSSLKSIACSLVFLRLFVAASHQTRLDTWSKARRPIKVGIKGRGRSGTSRDSNPAGLCCSSAHLVQCEPGEASSFTNPNVGPGTYAGLWLELDSKV